MDKGITIIMVASWVGLYVEYPLGIWFSAVMAGPWSTLVSVGYDNSNSFIYSYFIFKTNNYLTDHHHKRKLTLSLAFLGFMPYGYNVRLIDFDLRF